MTLGVPQAVPKPPAKLPLSGSVAIKLIAFKLALINWLEELDEEEDEACIPRLTAEEVLLLAELVFIAELELYTELELYPELEI
jgi:hypothetical protein